MQHRPLGQLDVSALGLGCMGFSQAYGVQDEAASIRTLHRALDLGITFFDTAEVYGPHRNEALLGRALKGREAVIATKFGFTYRQDRKDFGEITGIDGSPANAKRVIEASLKRLGREVIDLYYLHRTDPQVPIEETVGAMADLVQEGKVRALGLSEVSAATLRRAHATHPITALQSEYSLWTRDVEQSGVLAACAELGIGFVPFSPLGRGFLTGTIASSNALDAGDFRHQVPRFHPDHAAHNRVLVGTIEAIAAQNGATAAQVALAWVLAQGRHIVPIPGAKRIPHLEQNAQAAELELAPADLALLSRTFAPEAISGGRYSATMEAMADK